MIVPNVLTVSSNTCVPRMLFSVNSKELPKELSTCVCAAKCMTVSIASERMTYVMRSAEPMSPLTNLKFIKPATERRLFRLAQ